MQAKNEPSSGVVPVASYMMEFRAYKDDAWYTVCVLFAGDTLTVKYFNFSDENDEAFRPSQFRDWKELEDFKHRFRPLSKQLQDDDCHSLSPGTRVCACHSFGSDDVRFYDAVVDGVQESKHSWKTGEEECLCTFVLFWLHGPNARNLTTTSIESICVVQLGWELDSAVASFLEMAREKVELFSSSSVLVPTGVSSSEMEAQCAKQSIVNVCSPEALARFINYGRDKGPIELMLRTLPQSAARRHLQ
ncbi:unnamed protein product [Sphenostylis stenocarpa]|uniref:SAWADEE domain-containing protein n=1 Tax=Sphenostylis stenocarpa TaxID=92480 RepID=A0AA86STN0_9FABA|nr:unnamed protein product [Sphenostylis stenocarpa]